MGCLSSWFEPGASEIPYLHVKVRHVIALAGVWLKQLELTSARMAHEG